MIRNLKLKICEMCKKKYKPTCTTQRFCGSKTNKIGCSWENNKSYHKEKAKKPKYKAYAKKYAREWKRKQRKENTTYWQKQLEIKRKYAKNNRDKINAYNRLHTKRKQIHNRKRILIKRNVTGTHTLKEWKDKKQIHNYCCAICGIKEKDLEQLWEGTYFAKLTRDHIIPISKGGTDYITNIQPLCVSCNSKKRDII